MKRFFVILCAVTAFSSMAATQAQAQQDGGQMAPVAPTMLPPGYPQQLMFPPSFGTLAGTQAGIPDIRQDEEQKKKYHYERKKRLIDEADLPQRNFNNITYPY